MTVRNIEGDAYDLLDELHHDLYRKFEDFDEKSKCGININSSNIHPRIKNEQIANGTNKDKRDKKKQLETCYVEKEEEEIFSTDCLSLDETNISNAGSGELPVVWSLAFQDLTWDQFESYALFGSDRTDNGVWTTTNDELPDLMRIDENNNKIINNE